MLRINLLVFFTSSLTLLLSTSCQSQALSPLSDLFATERGKSIMSSYNCDTLKEKMNDKNFPLKGLAAVRAATRCEGVTFNPDQLSTLEKKLYSTEIANIGTSTSNKAESSTPELSTKELAAQIEKETSATEKFNLYKQWRAKLKRGNDRQAYVNATRKMYRWTLSHLKADTTNAEAQAFYYEAAQLLTRTYWNEDDTQKALRAIRESRAQIANSTFAELYYLKGRILEELNKTTEALKQYELALKDLEKYKPKSVSFNTDRIMWLKSWILYKDKKYEEAEKAFATLNETTTDLSERSRAQFYQARCLKFLGKSKEARRILESIIESDFFGYYGLVSYHELGKKLPPINEIKSPLKIEYDRKLRFLSQKDRDIFIKLIDFREYGLAEKAVLLMPKNKSEEISMSIFMAKETELYLAFFRAYSKLDNDEKIDVFVNFPDLVFPTPYKRQVDKMSSKTKIPSSLIYSIMKQESAFNEKARSAADAMGLMQVIPKLARQLSKKFDVPYRSPQDLYNPEINIQLGSFELMEQVKKQNGQLTFVAAAYNAGPGALSNWLKNRKRDDILEFIEEIPYDETKTYVKLIARNKLFYERISNRDESHEFPADFLNYNN